MQPDQQNNYWQPEADEPTEMYTPEPESTDAEPALNKPADDGLSSEASAKEEASAKDEPVHWRASEYIATKKNGLWFVIFVIVVLGLIAVDIFFWHSYIFSVLVVVMAVALIVFYRSPPKEIDYTLSGDQGLYIGEKLYHFSEFKAFGLIQDQGQHSIMLIPIKRFAIGVSVYFPEEVGEKIVDILGARLPMQALKLDAIDVIVRKLRL